MPNANGSLPPRSRDHAAEREVARIARSAALTCYGVMAVAGGRWYDRLATRLGLLNRGVRVRVAPRLEVALGLVVAPSVLSGKVVANVREAVEYAVARELGRPIDELTLTVVGR